MHPFLLSKQLRATPCLPHPKKVSLPRYPGAMIATSNTCWQPVRGEPCNKVTDACAFRVVYACCKRSRTFLLATGECAPVACPMASAEGCTLANGISLHQLMAGCLPTSALQWKLQSWCLTSSSRARSGCSALSNTSSIGCQLKMQSQPCVTRS